ncbi:phage/plasmid primase, P4 family [Streptomyces sp. f51]|uniref:phage/plasmid primase, P4 family n=1 Tax=Streptomyces sp. f51 TaxID=1827742 RepID=UPI0030D38B3C
MALTYARMGWSVFPLRPLTKVPATPNGFKDASTDPRVITAWWTDTPTANIGIATGISGLFVIDVDTKNGKKGAETLAQLVAEHGDLPDTYTVQTWSGGRHYFFEMPQSRLNNSTGTEKAGLGPDIDTRGDGGYVVAAPSVVEENGVRGKYDATLRIRPAELPAWVADRLTPRRPYVAPGRASTPPAGQRATQPLNGPQTAPEGLRRYIEGKCAEIRAMPVGSAATQPVNDIAFELAQFEEISVEELRAELRAAVDTWEDGHEKGYAAIEQGLKDAGTEPRVWEDRRMRRAAPRTSDQFEDSYLAESVVADVLTGAYRFVPGLGWKAWTGRVWRDCDELEVAEQIRRWAIQQYQGALNQERREPGSVPMDVITGWRRALKAEKQITVLKMARGFEGVFTTPEELDRDPDLLNVRNGVVNLRTGELLSSDPSRLMTKMAGAEYRPDYRHPDWEKTLEAVPEGIRDWFQIRMGQAATGHTPPDDLLIVSQGSGENGKSTVNATTATAMGDYYTLLSDRVLMADPSAHPTELMDLMGVRYAVMEETPEARRLDTQRLKRTVGTPQITARRIRQDSVTFTATHSMFISTNFRPEITETDHGSWRRLALVTFPYSYRKPGEELVTADDRPGDPGLRDRCKDDPDVHAAALAWMVEGAQRWYEANKVMPPLPESVADDTLKWRKESDTVLAFSDDVLIFESGQHIHGRDFKDELDAYLIGKGMSAWSEKTIAARFESHDVMRRHGVELKATRANPRRSRSPRQQRMTELNPYAEVPGGATYKAWIGVRFRSVADDVEASIQTDSAPPVHDVHADLVTPREENSYGVNQRSVNIVNIPGQGLEVPSEVAAPRARARTRDPRPGRPYVPPGGNKPPAA